MAGDPVPSGHVVRQKLCNIGERLGGHHRGSHPSQGGEHRVNLLSDPRNVWWPALHILEDECDPRSVVIHPEQRRCWHGSRQ
jgi:hypothetical protein